MIIIRLVNSVFQIYGLIMLARVLISWFTDLDRSAHPVVVFLHQATEPVLRLVRNVLPPMPEIDISPAIVLVLLVFVQQMVVRLLYVLLL